MITTGYEEVFEAYRVCNPVTNGVVVALVLYVSYRCMWQYRSDWPHV
jgi:hypothetical protein